MRARLTRDVPWAVFQPDGKLYWLGLAEDEAHAWAIALGWPDTGEIAEAKAGGMKALRVTVEPVRGEGA
jgi:hypothetical protein